MPHATSEERATPNSRATAYKYPSNMSGLMEKFPDHIDAFVVPAEGRARSPNKSSGPANGHNPPLEHWQPRKDGGVGGSLWLNGRASAGGRSHGRQKSLSDALRTIRTRRGSVSANAQEIAEALKAPVSPKLIVNDSGPLLYLCLC
jgi:solute carrier family 35, member E1